MIQPDYQWRAYVKGCGQSKLAQEFRSDTLFQSVVCPFIKQYAIQEQKTAATSILRDVLALSEGNFLPVEMDLVIGAVLEACGYRDLGSQFLKIALGAVILVLLVSVFFGES